MRILLIAFIISITSINIFSQIFELDSITLLQTSDNFLQKPTWSPTGDEILLTGEHNNGLYLFNFQKKSIQQINTEAGIGKEVLWVDSSTVQIRKKGVNRQISTLEQQAKEVKSTYVYVDLKKRTIYKSLSTGEKIKVTKKKANYYNPLLSPDKSQLIVHIGSLIYLMPTDGSGSKTKLVQGIAHSWSNDGRYIYYFLDESNDGHNIDNSELYVFDLQTMEKEQITDSPNMVEMWPAISPDGKKIAFTDGQSGKLYIAKIVEVKK